MEAVPNDDWNFHFVREHNLFVYEVDFGEEGKGRYIQLSDFNKVCESFGDKGAQSEVLPEYLKDPVNVYTLMLRGTIAVPSIRSMVDLRGEVPNGEDAQLARIVELQEQLSERAIVPSGWVLVPREPTEDMYDSVESLTRQEELDLRAIYQAMLTAIPKLPEGTQITSGDMVTVNRSDLLKLLEYNLNASSEAISATSGIDFIEAHGGPDADECIERVAYHLYYGLFAAERLSKQLADEVQS